MSSGEVARIPVGFTRRGCGEACRFDSRFAMIGCNIFGLFVNGRAPYAATGRLRSTEPCRSIAFVPFPVVLSCDLRRASTELIGTAVRALELAVAVGDATGTIV